MEKYKNYKALISKLKDISTLDSVVSVLAWDQQCYMPQQGHPMRAQQSAAVATIAHSLITSREFCDLLMAAEQEHGDNDADAIAQANLALTRRQFDRASKLSSEFVATSTKTFSEAHEAWSDARKKSDFSIFAPFLEKVVALKKQEIDAIGYDKTPYDCLLDKFEPGATTPYIDSMLFPLREALVPLVEAIRNSKKQIDDGFMFRSFAIEKQKEVSLEIAAALGFDFNGGRLDTAEHPFCTRLGSHDVRITTRYSENNFIQTLFAVIHETGHGLYEQGMRHEHFGTPVGDAASHGIHESQSLLWENRVARSPEFLNFWLPKLQKAAPDVLGGISQEAFYAAANTVSPSFIRVEADEATYNLHILIRYEIEQALINEGLPIADIPALWNEKYQHYLGITPSNDAEGCLQDVHWSFGGIGYFPSYALGHLYSACIYDAANSDQQLAQQFAQGDFSPLRQWLRTHIHEHGSHYKPQDLIEKVTGKKVSPQPFIDYLGKKYSTLYQL